KPLRLRWRNAAWPCFLSTKTRLLVHDPSKPWHAWLHRWGNLTALSLLYSNYFRYHMGARWLRVYRSLLRCSGSIQCSIRSGMTRAFKNSWLRQLLSNTARDLAVRERKTRATHGAQGRGGGGGGSGGGLGAGGGR